MNSHHISDCLADADQSVKNLMASILEDLSNQMKQNEEPCLYLEYFGAVLEVKLLSFGGEKAGSDNLGSDAEEIPPVSQTSNLNPPHKACTV